MKKCIVWVLFLSLVLSLCGCGAKKEEVPAKEPKEVIVYFPNWNLGNKAAERSGEVAGIPWDSVTFITMPFLEWR